MAAASLYRVDYILSADGHIWFRYSQTITGEPKIEIRDSATYTLQHTIDGLGDRPAGDYASRSLAIYWDTEHSGSPLAAGVYYARLYLDAVQRDERKFVILS